MPSTFYTPAFPSNLGLARLRTAFSPNSSRPSSTCTYDDEISNFSPAPSDASIFSSTSSASGSSRISVAVARLRQIIMLRHRPSVLELGLEEEKREYPSALDLLEPRPMSLGKMNAGMGFGSAKMGSPVVVSIFEVLEGKA